MKSLLAFLRGNRRRGSGREPVRRTGYLFHEGRALGAVRILDESEGGFRLAPTADPRGLPEAVTLLEVETAVAFEAAVAWRSAGEVGLRVLSEQRLRGYVPPEYQPLKVFWERAAVLTA